MRAIIYANQSSYRWICFVSRRAKVGETGTLVSIKLRGVSKSIGSSADDEPRGTIVGFAAAVAAWKVGLDQSGPNEGVNGLDCLHLFLLPTCAYEICVNVSSRIDKGHETISETSKRER